MDIELLSSLVRKLIIESDEVSVPGLGTFAATLVPASFSDRGYTINPPYRKLDFIPTGDEAAPTGADQAAGVVKATAEPKGGEVPAIVRRISSARKIAEAQAVAELTECVEAISARLEAERLAELPGLGKLRLTKEGEIFFVAAENLNIYPEGFGLEPVSLKNKEAQESAKEETESAAKSPEMTPAGPEITVSAAKTPETTPIELLIDPLGEDSDSNPAGTTESAALDGNSAPKPAGAAPADTPADTPTATSAVAPAASPVTTPAPAAPAPRKKFPTAVRVLLVIVAVLIVAVVALRLLGTYAPDFIDRLLYSQEELEILRQGL